MSSSIRDIQSLTETGRIGNIENGSQELENTIREGLGRREPDLQNVLARLQGPQRQHEKQEKPLDKQ